MIICNLFEKFTNLFVLKYNQSLQLMLVLFVAYFKKLKLIRITKILLFSISILHFFVNKYYHVLRVKY